MSRRLGGIVLALLLVLTSGLLAVRLLAPQLEHYRPQLETLLSQRLGLTLRLQGLEVAWRGWGPMLDLDGVSLHPAGGGAAVVSVSRVRLALDPWASLAGGRWTLKHLTLEGLRLVLERQPDGRVVLLGRESSGNPLDPEGLLRSLLAIDSLDLRGGELLLRPGTDRSPLVLRPLNLTLRRDGGQYRRLGLEARLPPELGGTLRAAARLQPRQSGGLEGNFYLQASPLRADGVLQLARWLGHAPHRSVGGALDLELWGELAGWMPRQLAGRTALAGLTLGRAPYRAAPTLGDLTGLFRLTRNGETWSLGGDWQTPAGAGLALDLAWGGRSPSLLLIGRDLPLELSRSLAPLLGPGAVGGLAQLQPAGRLTFLTLVRPGNDRYRLTARFEDLSLAPGRTRPGLTGLAGTLSLEPEGGRLTLGDRPALVTGGALAAPVAFVPAGALSWRRDEQGLTLTPAGLSLSNADLALTLAGQVHRPRRGEPRVDLTADFRMENLARIPAYLPVGVMRPRLVGWLSTALEAGRVPRGRLVFRGRPGDFPFEQRPGEFRVLLEVNDAVLAYNPEWPAIRDLAAELEFLGSGLTIRASRGRLMETVQLADVEAIIPDLEQAVLTVRGRAAGSGAGMLDFVAASPLWRRLGDALGRLTVEGDTTLALELEVPLDRSPPRVAGTVGFDGNRVAVAGSGVVLERVRGELDFTERGVRGEDIRLHFRGDPALLALDSRPGATEFRLTGELGPRALGEWALPYLEGKAPTRAVLTVPGRGGPLVLTVDSTLAGMAVDLPPPLGKPAADSRALAARAEIGAGTLSLELDYGRRTRAALAFEGLPRATRLERGEVRIDAGAARLPDQPGLDVVARLGEVHWPPALPVGGGAGGRGLPPWLNTLDVRAARLLTGGYQLNGVVVRAANRNGALMLDLAGEAVTGQLYWPAVPTPVRPVTVALDHLHLQRTAAPARGKREGGTAPDPRILPPLVLTVADLRLDGRALGTLSVDLKSTPGGVQLDDLELESPLHDLVVRGQWQGDGGGQVSRLNLEFRTRDLSDSLTRLVLEPGLEPGLEAGEADLSARLEWPGPLFAPRAEGLSGQGELRVGAGRLPRLEPGVGRIMGLFSLAGVSRRLALDFSDLFQQGLAFDRIDGRFILKAGHLLTDNLIMEGPAADVGLRGRIGLAARDQDLEVTVLPQTQGVLPVAGALAGGPVVGAALFLAEQLFKEDIGAITRYRYRVKGTWDAPQVETMEQSRGSPSTSPTGRFGDR